MKRTWKHESTWTIRKKKEKKKRKKKHPSPHTLNGSDGSDGDEKPVAQWMHAKKGKSEDCFVREFVYLLRAKYPPSNTHFGSKWMSAENITSA